MTFAILFSGCDENQVTALLDNKYVARCATYDISGKMMIVIDPKSPRVITMDPWPELIFKYADGEHTVSANILGDYCEA